MRKTALGASLLTLALAACNGDFNKPARLDTPRVLAMKADPPQPSYGVSTTLSTLLYQPPLDRQWIADRCPSPAPTTYHWSWCPWPMSANTNYQCPISQPEFDQLFARLGLGTAPSLDLGTGETATLTNPFPAQLLYALCRGDIGTTLGGENAGGGSGRSVFNCDLAAEDYNVSDTSKQHPIGFKVTVKVEITPACPQFLPAGFNPLVAVYSLHLPTDDTLPVNNNPVLSGIWVTQNGSEADGGGAATLDAGGEVDGGAGVDGGAVAPGGVVAPDGGILLDDEASVLVERNVHVGLQLEVSIDTAEHLAVPSTIDYDSTNKLTRHYEHLTFAWYADAGNFSGRGKGRNTGYLPTAYPQGVDEPPTDTDREHFEFNTTNTWDLPRPEDWGENTARIIIVLRDGRGGVDWTSKLVRLP